MGHKPGTLMATNVTHAHSTKQASGNVALGRPVTAPATFQAGDAER